MDKHKYNKTDMCYAWNRKFLAFIHFDNLTRLQKYLAQYFGKTSTLNIANMPGLCLKALDAIQFINEKLPYSHFCLNYDIHTYQKIYLRSISYFSHSTSHGNSLPLIYGLMQMSILLSILVSSTPTHCLQITYSSPL